MADRTLRPGELSIVQAIFAAGLETRPVRISEGSSIAERIGQFGALVRGRPSPRANAVTVGNTSFFPRPLTADDMDIGWLIHELTHQWQYQHYGIVYLAQAIVAPTYVYCEPGETPAAALTRCAAAGKTFANFNREQQGDIVRDYYFALRASQEGPAAPQSLAAWAPYLAVIRQPKR
ncbi:MAG: hypothetical protein M1482_11015 [Chloroflexi bacterium]|nr:hypothetical protein [Chloroflexota bacterium]